MVQYDDHVYEVDDVDAARKRKRLAQQMRQHLGTVSDEMLEYLDYEDDAEFDAFEPIPRRQRQGRG